MLDRRVARRLLPSLNSSTDELWPARVDLSYRRGARELQVRLAAARQIAAMCFLAGQRGRDWIKRDAVDKLARLVFDVVNE